MRPLSNPRFHEPATATAFSAEEAAWIIGRLDPTRWASAEVRSYEDGPAGRLDLDTRSVIQQPVPDASDGWVARRLSEVLTQVNDEVYRFDTEAASQEDLPHVLRYEAGTADHFSMHTDAGPAFSTRKLSYSVQLSDPATYRGGDLVFFPDGQLADRTLGTVNVFPSFRYHSVTPVTAGVRFAIVGWIHGRTFR